MGNSLSNNIQNNDYHDNESILKEIDEIATRYIFKQNMVDMLRFSDKEYREDFAILTCHILEKKLSNIHIDTVKNRVLNSKNNSKNTDYGEIVYFSELEKLKPLLRDERAKKRALYVISKFYIKIFTLFGGIVSVIDPQYIYNDENGEEKFFYLKDFDDLKMIDPNTNKLRVYHLENPLSLIKRRLTILKNKMEEQENDEFIVINPGEELCKMNISQDNNSNSYYLSNEIGIKELDSLYYDLYDEDTATWSGRSNEMKEQYEKDVTLFYQIFTGKKNKPSSVKSFEDIELLDFHNLKRCKNNDYFQDLLVSKNDVLFQKYLTKIEEIQEGTRSYKKQLLYILKSLFSKIYKDENPEQYEYTIHPDLNMDTLLEKQKQVKNCIVQMYSSCERNFIEALLLYEKMYENRHGELINAQINNISFNDNKNRKNINNIQQSTNRNVILNDDLLLDNKIRMRKINNNLLNNTSQLLLPNDKPPVVEEQIGLETTQPQQSPVQENVNDSMEVMNDISSPPPTALANNQTPVVEEPIMQEFSQKNPVQNQQKTNSSMEDTYNISTPTPTQSPNNQEPQFHHSNKIPLNVNSTNTRLKNNKSKSIADKSEETQRSIINGLSSFFS